MENDFKGVIIEESLEDVSVLKSVHIISTEIEPVIPEHKTPWVTQWTLHTVEISFVEVETVAEKISRSLDSKHEWYADFKNDKTHFIIFKNKIFKIDRTKVEEYNKATEYGISIGIPSYQVDFAPNTVIWKR